MSNPTKRAMTFGPVPPEPLANQARNLMWWMRLVGVFYLFLFVACVFLRLPIEVEGPEGVLARAAAGDATARFVVESWVTYGLMLGAIGVGLLLASRIPARSSSLVWTVLGVELAGIVADIYKLARGYALSVSGPWLIIHSVIILTGVLALRRTRSSVRTSV